jgi:hypothetical protein
MSKKIIFTILCFTFSSIKLSHGYKSNGYHYYSMCLPHRDELQRETKKKNYNKKPSKSYKQCYDSDKKVSPVNADRVTHDDNVNDFQSVSSKKKKLQERFPGILFEPLSKRDCNTCLSKFNRINKENKLKKK